MKPINLYRARDAPDTLEELFTSDGTAYASIFTAEEARRCPFTALEKEGIEEDSNGHYNIAVNAPELTEDTVRTALDMLTEKTGMKYTLAKRIKTPRKKQAQARQE